MTNLTLLTKISNDKQLKRVGKALKTQLEGLEVEIKILGTVAGGWVQISLSGEDEGIATNYIIQEVGLCPSNFEHVEPFSILKGYIGNIRKNPDGLSVDVGLFQPEIIHAIVPLTHLQAELMGGRKIDLRKIAELFGFCEGVPIKVKLNGFAKNESYIDAELSSKQIRKYEIWRESLLDRLLTLNPTLQEIETTISHSSLNRDIIEVEPLDLFVHSLTCKLGTDAAGLIPKIGRNLKKARFAVFNSKTLRHFLKT